MQQENTLERLKQKAIDLSGAHADFIQEVASTVWGYAEISGYEYRSAAYLSGKLEEMGFSVQRGVGGFPTSFIGTYTYGSGGPVIGLLAEYDALPEIGHGCGHNLFAAGAFGTAAVMKALLETEKINATIKVFGTPAEEELGSKTFFAKQGIFDGVDCFFGFHPLEFSGVLYARHSGIVSKNYKFYGKTAHAGADPHLGISALDAVEIMNVTVNYLREHVTSDVRMHYVITNGGSRANVVPDFASSNYYIRAQDFGNLRNVCDRVDTISKGIAMAIGCRVEIEELESFANTLPNRRLAELAYANCLQIGPPQFTKEEQDAVKEMGLEKGMRTDIRPLPNDLGAYTASTDEGDASWIAPWIRTCMTCLAEGTPGHSVLVSKQANMSSGFRGTTQTVKVVTATICDILLDPNNLQAMKADFENSTRETAYERTINAYPRVESFPQMKGAKFLDENSIAVNAEEAVIFPHAAGKTVNVYAGAEKIGSAVMATEKEDQPIVLERAVQDGEILTLKYWDDKFGAESTLGYVRNELA